MLHSLCVAFGGIGELITDQAGHIDPSSVSIALLKLLLKHVVDSQCIKTVHDNIIVGILAGDPTFETFSHGAIDPEPLRKLLRTRRLVAVAKQMVRVAASGGIWTASNGQCWRLYRCCLPTAQMPS